jgi:hypothetical protein
MLVLHSLDCSAIPATARHLAALPPAFDEPDFPHQAYARRGCALRVGVMANATSETAKICEGGDICAA